MAAYRIVHYLNQFFGGIGGEDKAGHWTGTGTGTGTRRRL